MTKRQSSKYYFNTREVIEIQSSYYYTNNETLGFTSLGNTVIEYPKIIYILIDRILQIAKSKQVKILELGPGTLFFAQNLLNHLRSNNYEVSYTAVDVNRSLESKSHELGINFVHSNFEKFSKNNHGKFDFLIMNQSLDMWAGQNYINHKNKIYKINWKLFDKNLGVYLSKDDLNKISQSFHINNLFWIKFYQGTKKRINSLNFYPKENEKILLPYGLYSIIQKIRLGGFFQDYWNFSYSISLRTGLQVDDCTNILNTFPYNSQNEIIENNSHITQNQSMLLSIVKAQEINLINWFPSNIIPFGIRDVTYSPEIFRVASLIEKFGFNFEIFSIATLVNKLLSPEKGQNINENEFGSEKNILIFEKKRLLGLFS